MSLRNTTASGGNFLQCISFILFGSAGWFGGAVTAGEIRAEFAMLHDPQLTPVPIIRRLGKDVLPLWTQALRRPEADYQRLAAEAIAEVADDGFLELTTTIDDLLRILTSEESHPAAQHAAARALISLDARSAAPSLMDVSQRHGSQLRLLIEPALAQWQFEPIRPIWRERVRDVQTHRRELILALDGLAVVNDGGVLPSLTEIVHSASRSPDVRLAAARTAGLAAPSGLEADVTRLLNREAPSVLDRLCAVALLKRHRSEVARKQLERLGTDGDPTVAEQALGMLFEIDPALVLPLAEESMRNVDPKVRRRGADAYVAVPTRERVVSLSRLLDDLHPDVRRSVAGDLRELAHQPELSDAVRDSATQLLAADSWRGQEQAALLLGSLDHEPAATRLLNLLSAERPEVKVAAAWALRSLAMPQMLPAMMAHAQHQTAARRSGSDVAGLDGQVAHLFEAFGLMEFAPAEGLLREHVPKNHVLGYYSRGAAIWALGHLHAGTPEENLASQFAERMNDLGPEDPPESDLAWRMSATSLGRMRAASQLPALQQRLSSTRPTDPVAHAVRWSIMQITGDELPEFEPVIRSQGGWFLEPLPRTGARR